MAEDFTTYATNAFSVKTKPIDYNIPGTPSIQTYHASSIVVKNSVVGRILSWQPAGAYTREGSHVYEINNQTWGLPVDYVPGRAVGFNVTWTRNEVWTQELELTLGYGAVWENLTDQTFPFTAMEMLFRGSSPYRTWTYFGCWFTSKTPSAMEAEGNGIIKVECDMAYVSRKRTL